MQPQHVTLHAQKLTLPRLGPDTNTDHQSQQNSDLIPCYNCQFSKERKCRPLK